MSKYKDYVKEKENIILAIGGFVGIGGRVFHQEFDGKEFYAGDEVEDYLSHPSYIEAENIFRQLIGPLQFKGHDASGISEWDIRDKKWK